MGAAQLSTRATRVCSWSICLLVTAALTATCPVIAAGWGFEPEFTEPVNNLTVPLGRDAIFTCYVTRLGGHKVGWVKADTKAIQAIHLTVVTHNPRVSVEHAGPSQWKLVIKSVRKEDAGAYMCQINTDPMKSQMSYLDVTEAPDIVDELTPSEERVMENGQLKLMCKARGHPAPRVTWRREDGDDLMLSLRPSQGPARSSKAVAANQNASKVTSYEGEVLRIAHVTKRHMGIYQCIASNGVPPAVSKRVAVTVLFAPTVTVQNQIVAVPLKTNVTLECLVESSPKSVYFWYKDDKMIVNASRLALHEQMETAYRVRMTLTIQQFRGSDSGRYVCQAKNSLGEAEEAIQTYDIPPPVKTTTAEPVIHLVDNNIFPLANQVTLRPSSSSSSSSSSSHQRTGASGKDHHHQQHQHRQHQQIPTSSGGDESGDRPASAADADADADADAESTGSRKATQIPLRPAKSGGRRSAPATGATLVAAVAVLSMTAGSWWPNVALVGHLAAGMT